VSAYGVFLRLLCLALAACALGGLIARGRWRACLGFGAYLTSAALGRALLLAWPQTFWTWPFLFWTDVLQLALSSAVALEVAFKIFRPLPNGNRHMRLTVGLVLAVIAIGLALWATPVTDAFQGTLTMQQASYGVTFLFVAILLVTRSFGVPVDPLHRDILCGFTLLLALVAYGEALSSFDPAFAGGRDFVVKSAYPLLLLAWCVGAWRRDVPSRLSPVNLRRLQPWRTPA
jgi:hypothetical protein